MALNPLDKMFFNFAKRYMLSCLSQFDNQIEGHRNIFWVISTGYTVTMVTHYAMKLTMIGSQVFEYLSDTNIVKSHDKQR